MLVAGALQVVVRHLPSHGLEGALRVHLLPDTLHQAQLKVGDVCEITSEDGSSSGFGIAWRADDRMGSRPKLRPAKMTETFRSACGFDEGSKVTVAAADATVRLHRADNILLTDVTPAHYHSRPDDDGGDDACWRIRVAHLLSQCDAVAPGIAFDVLARRKQRRRYHIDHIHAAAAPHAALFSVCDHTQLVIAGTTFPPTAAPAGAPTALLRPDASPAARLDNNRSSGVAQAMDHLSLPSAARHTLNLDRIGGLLEATQELNFQLETLLSAAEHLNSPLRTNQPVLIHGYEGTGKSMLLNRLADAPFQKVVRLDRGALTGGSVSKNQQIIKDAFREAAQNQPSLLLMDNLEKLAPADDVAYAGILGEELELVAGARILVVAATRSPLDVEPSLVGPYRFSLEIELSVPDLIAREQILNVLRRKPAFAQDAISSHVAATTHGFTGRDLALLCLRAEHHAGRRYRREATEAAMATASPNPPAYERVMGSPNEMLGNSEPPKAEVAAQDFDAVRPSVRPAALRQTFTEKPRTTWANIGGSTKVKESFDGIIGRSLKGKEQMQKLGLEPPKGVLLYGPPGCSKTLTAQAVANSYDFNFIAVKGAELISMYVGESERAVRDVFRKAKAAAPCVIFFDEIDSIGSDRDSGTKGLHVLTTLLNEMDGFEILRDVFILAATNKPETLDPALMRPGRFDKHVYLGLPNDVARQEILMIASRNVPLSADVSIDKLVAETEGYSGAEIVRICNAAKQLALDRCMASGDEISVCSADFEAALGEVRKGVTRDMLQGYEAFAGRRDE